MKNFTTTIPESLKTAYKHFGFDVVPVKGNSRFGDTMVAYIHDGVHYTMDSHNNEKDNQPDVEHSCVHLQMMINHSHSRLKKIYDYLVEQDIGDVWIMAGGGSQVQAFFGNFRGYVAILSMHDEKTIPKPTTKYSLQVNGKYNDQYFDGKKRKFKMENIKLITYKESYGKGEEDDEDYDLVYGY